MTVEQLKEKHPLVWEVFFKPSKETPGYQKFKQIGLELKAKAVLKKR